MSMDTKDLAQTPSLPTPLTNPWSLILDAEKLGCISFKVMLAAMLMPWAKVVSRTGTNYYTRAEWITFASGQTFWNMSGAQVGDVLVVSGTTKDTNQRVVYYFLAKTLKENSDFYGKCFLLLLEGEPPRWMNTE